MAKETDDKIIDEAKKRFLACEDWEADFRKRFVEDLKFANADPENGWQWDQVLQQNRTDKRKPCLTINKTRQHNLQIINDAKQNKPGVNIRPVGDGATYEAAQVFEGVVRHIEYQSNAEQAYDTATVFQVEGGIGYWRVITDYVSPDTFDQEIYIRRIKNPDAVYLDPDISEADGSDARFGFIFEDMSRDRFEIEYPECKGDADLDVIGKGDFWCSKDSVRIAEYYRKTQKADKLVAFVDPMTQQQVIVRKSAMDEAQKQIFDFVKDDPSTNERSVLTDQIEWFKIAGNKIIDRRIWPGSYVPIVRVIGEETIIEGKMDRKGHTRSMKDAQRMYNYWTSEGTAQVALQTQTPYIAAVEATEGLETYWAKSNLDDAAYLPYNAYAEDGTRTIPPPQRTQPPTMASAYIEGMRICENQLMMASGQFQSQFGANENATSGKAINERQRQGDNATYHYIDNLAIGIKYTGKILIDLIPKIYDTPRVIRILAKDGTENQVQIDPNAQQAHQPFGQEDTQQTVSAIFNPNVGRYEIESDTGPGYATRRQEAFNAMTQIAAQDKGFLEKAGDLYWKAADFPMADELAERYANTIPAAVKGKGPPPEVQQLQGQLQQAHDAIVKLQQQLDDKDKDINIRAFDAESKRITAIGNSGPAISPEQIQPLIRQTLIEMLMGGSPEGAGGQGQQMPTEQPETPQPPPMGQPTPIQPGMQQ